MTDKYTKEILAFADDHVWLYENFDALLKKYQDLWIGVKDHKVIASDPDLIKLRDKLPDPTHTCVEFITREHLEMIL